MKIYTRTGDKGTTALVGGARVAKDSPRLEAYGTVDELNSWLGLLLASSNFPAEERELLTDAQSRLFDIGGRLAGTPSSGITEADIAALEASIDRMTGACAPQTCFLLPGGCTLAAQANVARTVCRRAERRMEAVKEESGIEPEAMAYINRLSDWLFALSRYCNACAGTAEHPWLQR